MPEIASYLLFLLAGLYLLIELAGIAAAIEAIMRARTPQGAIAWSLFLVMLPLVALPAYLFLGDRKFSGYVDARRSGDAPLQRLAREINERLPKTLCTRISAEESTQSVLSQLARLPFLGGNRSRLLINGEATFSAIFDAIDKADAGINWSMPRAGVCEFILCMIVSAVIRLTIPIFDHCNRPVSKPSCSAAAVAAAVIRFA
jgi:hypothetical protein